MSEAELLRRIQALETQLARLNSLAGLTVDPGLITLGQDTKINGDLETTGTITGDLTGDVTGTASNADKLDNLDSTDFAAATHYHDGTIGRSGSGLTIAAGGGGLMPQTTNQGSGAAGISFNRANAYAVNFGLDTDNVLKVGGWSMGNNSYKIWHQGNDGAGSGLDADLLDSQQSSYYNPAILSTPLTHASWSAAAVAAGTYSIDVTAFGVPSGKDWVLVNIQGYWTAANNNSWASVRPAGSSTFTGDVTIMAQVANINAVNFGMVRVNRTTNLIECRVNNATTGALTITIWGYGYASN